jgi:hypothetical protein
MEERMRTFGRRCLRAKQAGILFIMVMAFHPPAHAAQLASSAGPTIRPRIDLTNMVDLTRTIPLALITPAQAQNIGPGAHLIIDIPGAGTFGCTANFVWASGGARYLGAAGHCFLPEGTVATHGAGADFNASGDVVKVCVSNCSFGGETGFTLTGDLVQLGAVAYARQSAGGVDIGNDFGVVTIPASLASRVRPSMPVFGGPTTVDTVDQAEPLCQYGNGVVVGETFLTMARVGVGGGSDATTWMGDLASAPGDSGSAVVTCDANANGFTGRGAAGILTHLSLAVCPCNVNTLTFQQGVVFGTTVARAIAMAQEAGLSLSVVFP